MGWHRSTDTGFVSPRWTAPADESDLAATDLALNPPSAPLVAQLHHQLRVLRETTPPLTEGSAACSPRRHRAANRQPRPRTGPPRQSEHRDDGP